MVHGMFISFTIKLLSRLKIVNMSLSFLAHLHISTTAICANIRGKIMHFGPDVI